jgi:hypothetical protein
LLEIFQRLVGRNARRTEAEIQADVRQFILSAPFELEARDLTDVFLESPVGDRRRIDVEAGSTVIEVKRDLRSERVRREAEEQLAGYVEFRMNETGLRYVGVLTDGTEWNCYDLVDGRLRQVSEISLEDTPVDADRLVVWLEGVLATTRDIAPTAQNIEERLGAGSSAYKLDRATLATLYERNRDNPTVVVKRKLWTQLLISALGTQFEDDDELFIDHTLLVNTSEIIAHAVLGLHVESLTPETLLSGDKFNEAGVYGVVEADFFSWSVEVEGGEKFIRTLAKRLMRFVWSDVNQDVLKILYENFIGRETRKRLGEYYTPDWLAEVIVSQMITDPNGNESPRSSMRVRYVSVLCSTEIYLRCGSGRQTRWRNTRQSNPSRHWNGPAPGGGCPRARDVLAGNWARETYRSQPRKHSDSRLPGRLHSVARTRG